MSSNNSEMDNLILDICKNDYKDFINKANVVGIGLGYKVTDRQFTDDKCIIVFVSNKLPESYLEKEDIIPPLYKGAKTDVLLSGEITTCSFSGKIRPLIGGYGIGPVSSEKFGTTGCLVTDGTDNYILSNNHVLADGGKVPEGTPIVQPCTKDNGKNPEDTIATMSRFIPIEFKTSTEVPENYVDCAIAKVVDKEQVSNKIAFVGEILGVVSPYINQSVQKVGKISEITYGLVLAIGATIKVNYDDNEAIFKNQIVTTKMTTDGDSGSLLMDSEGNALGLCYAHTLKHSYHNDISDVLNKLNVKIVTKKE